VIALVVTILVIAANGRRSAEFVFTDFTPQSGWTPGWSWCGTPNATIIPQMRLFAD